MAGGVVRADATTQDYGAEPTMVGALMDQPPASA
jgi:hypothetical protein